MRILPPERRRGRGLIVVLALAVASSAACRRADLPEKNSPKYLEAVRAFYVGLSALQVGDDVRAEEKLKEATALAPDEPAAWADLGLLYMRQRQFDLAATNLEKARRLAPENAVLYVLTGQLESGRGNYAEAVKQFRRAAELDPRNLKALYALGRETGREGEGGEAEELRLLQQILGVEPRNLSVRLDVARLAAKRGEAELFDRMMGGFAEDAAAWPSEAQEQLKAVRTAAAAGNTRAAAPRVQFLRNVLVRLPEYRQSRLAVEDPPEILSEPFTRFVKLESPSPAPAAPDEALTFNVEPLEEFGGPPLAWGGAVSLAGEGAPTPLFANARGVQLAGGVKVDFPDGIPAAPPTPAGVAALDFDYDFKTDLALASVGGFRLYRQESPTSFVDVTAKTNLPGPVVNSVCTGAWAADIEADGDLDIVLGVSAKDGPPHVLRNNGDGTFTVLYPFDGLAGLSDFVWADFDGDGDPDAALLDAQGRLAVFTNERAGQFRQRPSQANTGTIALGVADVNRDGLFDLLLLGADGALTRLSDKGEGAGWESAEVLRGDAPPAGLAPGASKITAADLDNNGGIDLLISGTQGARAWLSDAEGRFKPLGLPETISNSLGVSVADADADGRLDLFGVSNDRRAFKAAGRGSKNYHWQLIRPRAANATGDQRINSFGVGGEMEIRAGLLVQKQLISGPLVHFGLGEQAGADVVRVVWPNGSVRAEFELRADTSVLAEQRLKGSCPSLFAFDGKRMSFVKDCAPWSPAIGLRINSYQTLRVQQTEEWVKVRGDQLAPREGFYDLSITAELWETFYLDRYSFAVVDHPAGTEVFVDERTAREPPALKVYTTGETRPFARAWDDAGADVSEVVRRLDGR
ncbi:MAG TPA: FG-GAP-like repeat-containing protein, partial [Pyrinomonadaceae bacterium]